MSMITVYGKQFINMEDAQMYMIEIEDSIYGEFILTNKKKLKLMHLKDIDNKDLCLKPCDFNLSAIYKMEFWTINKLMQYLSHSKENEFTPTNNITEHFEATKWTECLFFKGHLYKVVKGNFISFDPQTLQGYIFDCMDILKVYDVSLDSFIKLNNIKIENSVSRSIEKAEYILTTIRKKGFHKKYPNLYKYIKSYIPVLDKFTQIFIEGLNKIDAEYISNVKVSNGLEYLVGEFKKVDIDINKGRLSQVLNAFCLIGLYSKVMNLNDSDYKTDYIYNINYFKVEANFNHAEKVASELLSYKLPIKNITQDAVTPILGKYEAEKVFQHKKNQQLEDGELEF